MFGYQWDFGAVLRYRELFVNALGVTLLLSVLVIVLGVLAGFVLAAMRRSRWFALRALAIAFIDVIRAVPPLVLLVWIYYCLPILAGWKLSAFSTTVVALSLYSGAFYAEIIRAGFQSVDRGHIEAGLTVGMSRAQVLRRIVGPLAFQKMLPPFVSQCILVIKNTSLGSYVAVQEVLYMGQRISNETFRPIEVLTTVALLYIAIIIPATYAIAGYERRRDRKMAR